MMAVISACTSSLRLHLLPFVLLAYGTHALSASVSRQAIEFPEDIILLRAADEPPFPETAVKTCTLNREKGFSLLTPGFADGMPSVNFVKTPASYINSSAVVCHLQLATNATGHPIPTPAITAGQTTVVVDMGGSPCDIALRKYCPGKFQKGPPCWTCARTVHHNQTKEAGCDKGAYKAYCGPQTAEAVSTVLGIHSHLAQSGLGLGKGVCKSGNYTCATIEHFAAFAPAFGRRPYIREQNLSLVVRTDYSLAGTVLNISTVIGGASLHGSIVGTENGYSRLTFPLSLLPPVASGNFSETVLINLTLPDGRTRGKPRRFMRAVPPASGMPTSTVQVDHESGGLLMDGVRKTCNGWFNNPNGGIAGLPVSDTCDIARTNDLQNQAYRAARNQAAQVADQGMKGITFLRDAIMTECDTYDWECKQTDAYERDWANRLKWLDAAAVAGVHVLVWVGVDHLSSCRSGWIDSTLRPTNVNGFKHGSCYIDGVPQPEVIARYEDWVFESVKRLRDHPAVAGYYGCDDCCHTGRGTFCALEYRGIAKIRQEIFALDPYHPTFGTSACGEVWMWQEEGFGLGLDVVMKEGYAGLIGASSPTFQGTPRSMKAYPMTLEPLWACGDCSASPQALRSTVYGKVLTQSSDNNFYVGTDRTANARNWQIMAATERVSTELQSLTGSVRSRAHFQPGYTQPVVECVHAVVLPSPQYHPGANGTFDGLVSARVFQEETPVDVRVNATAAAAYFCYTLIAVNAHPFPFVATLRIDHLSVPTVAGRPRQGQKVSQSFGADPSPSVLPLTRLFRGTCALNPLTGSSACDVNATLLPNGSATLTDVFDIETTNVYRIGCQPSLLQKATSGRGIPGELCLGSATRTADCGFEQGDLARGMFMPSWPETMLLEFNTTDYRQYVSLDSADPYHGRHSARINAPNADAVLMPIKTKADANFSQGGASGKYRVRFAARSSPPGVSVGAIFAQYGPHGSRQMGPPPPPPVRSQRILTTEWQMVDVVLQASPVRCAAPVLCAKIPLQIWAKSPFSTGALIGIDEISIMKVPVT